MAVVQRAAFTGLLEERYNHGMLPKVLPTWRLRYLADGLGLFPPEGLSHGGLRVRERLRPLASARAIVDRSLRALPMEHTIRGPIEQLVTCEGEYAALQTTTGTTHGEPFVRSIGIVFGDDFYTMLDGGSTIPDKFDFFTKAVRDFTYFYALGLGHRRKRRFLYDPPAGFVGYPRGLCTLWHPADYPQNRALITVFPASPAGDRPADTLEQVLHEMTWTGFVREHLDEPEPVFSDHELSGMRWRVTGRFAEEPTTVADVVVLQDDRFAYVLRLSGFEKNVEAGRDVFERLVRSVWPIPLPEPTTTSDALLHWHT
jgi:hypothetical protein